MGGIFLSFKIVTTITLVIMLLMIFYWKFVTRRGMPDPNNITLNV